MNVLCAIGNLGVRFWNSYRNDAVLREMKSKLTLLYAIQIPLFIFCCAVSPGVFRLTALVVSCMVLQIHFTLNERNSFPGYLEALLLFAVMLVISFAASQTIVRIFRLLPLGWCVCTDMADMASYRKRQVGVFDIYSYLKAMAFYIYSLLLLAFQSPDEGECDVLNWIATISATLLEVYIVLLVSRNRFLRTSPEKLTKVKALLIGNPGDFEGKAMQNACDKIVFERINACFEKDRLFLNPMLTIEELSRAIYSNKAYVSRSIRNCASTNFCGYVNTHRVNYAKELFKKDMTLRVNTLAMMSGFRTVQTFTNSFKDLMNETPTEWCRSYKERHDFRHDKESVS